MKQIKDLKVAIVHDFLVQNGGAEKVLEVIAEMFPEAPIYTLLYDKEKMYGKFEGKDIRPSYLQKFPKFLRHRYRWLLPFCMVAPETFNLREFDLVISSSGAWAKGIVTKLNTIHISYIHSPMRFVWELNHNSQFTTRNSIRGFFVKLLFNYLRIWDRLAADRPDYLVSNSKYTQERVKKYYRRDSNVIYPPVEIKSKIQNPKSQINSPPKADQSLAENFNPPAGGQNSKITNYFLIVSRLSPYKKVDLVVKTFNKLGLPLVIIGEGRQEKYLRKIAGKNIKILGWQNEENLRKYYSNARAFIFPAVDDFGITMVEAMNYGIPVIALRKGGAVEIIQENITGEFFNSQTMEILADAVRRFIKDEKKYDQEEIKKRAREFSKERFIKEFGEYIDSVILNSKL
jgi:glycosyltransferase involved in cell wall biosynthesis